MCDISCLRFKTDYPTYIIYEIHQVYPDRTVIFRKVVEKDINYLEKERKIKILEMLKKKE
jgi:hypothetical protein